MAVVKITRINRSAYRMADAVRRSMEVVYQLVCPKVGYLCKFAVS